MACKELQQAAARALGCRVAQENGSCTFMDQCSSNWVSPGLHGYYWWFYEILQMNTEKMKVPREGHEPDLCGVH